MGWLEDDEMMRQWEYVSQEEEEKITVRKMEGRRMQVEGAQKVPELLVTQVLTIEKEPKKEKYKGKVEGCSKENMEEKASKQESKGTEEMVQ